MYPTAEKLLDVVKGTLEQLGVPPDSYEHDWYAREVSVALLRALAERPDDMVVHWANQNGLYEDASPAIFTGSLEFLATEIESAKESDTVH